MSVVVNRPDQKFKSIDDIGIEEITRPYQVV